MTMIQFNTAVLAKQKGFTQTNATQSQLQKWLREKHNIHMLMKIFVGDKVTYVCDVVSVNEDVFKRLLPRNTYEQALEQALVNGLNYIKRYETTPL